MATAYLPFAPSISYYPLPPPKHGQSSRFVALNNMSAGAYNYPTMAMTYPGQRPSFPTGPAQRPLHPAGSWTDSQSCLFGASFPADLSAALPVSQKPMMFFLPEGDSSPLGVLATGTEFPPSSPSDASSSTSPSASPAFVHAVCNAPLVAPVPLPYHSPTFLQFDLPDDDEDLSHPPYVSRPHKRKRSEAESEEDSDMVAPGSVKRRLGAPPIPASVNMARHRGDAPAARYPLRRWPVQPGASHGTGMPG